MSVKKFTKGVYVCRVRNTQNYRIIFHIYADMQSELKTLSFFVANRYIVPKKYPIFDFRSQADLCGYEWICAERKSQAGTCWRQLSPPSFVRLPMAGTGSESNRTMERRFC